MYAVQVARQEQELAAAGKASDAVMQGLVHRMLMELETGGNIRSASLHCFTCTITQYMCHCIQLHVIGCYSVPVPCHCSVPVFRD